MLRSDRIFCLEAFDVDDPLVRAAERLYTSTQHPAERIPWGWIARSLKGRAARRPGAAGSHLLTALPEEHAQDATRLAGFAYGSHVPGYGGYLSYLGVAPGYRRRGVGTRLMEQMAKVLDADAGALDEPLPFVVWESKRPAADDPEADWRLWEARVKLFDRAGGLWLDGLDLFTPNYGPADGGDEGEPVVLQLFVKPVDRAAVGFTPDYLCGIAAGLLERIYRMRPGDPLHARTMASATPRLRPAIEAGRRSAAVLN